MTIRPLCKHASDTPPKGGRERRCGLGLHATVTRLGECATCEKHEPREDESPLEVTAVPSPLARKPLAVLAVCEHRSADSIGGGGCSLKLYRCALHQCVTVQTGRCLDAARSCATCDDHTGRR